MSEEKASSGPASPQRDIPFYNGEPVRISRLDWLVVLAMAAAGFAALVTAPTLAPGRLGGWIGNDWIIFATVLSLGALGRQ